MSAMRNAELISALAWRMLFGVLLLQAAVGADAQSAEPTNGQSSADPLAHSHRQFAGSLDVTALLVSDLFYHGTTESVGEPAFALSAEWQVTPRYFIGFAASQAIQDGVQQRQRSFLGYVGAGFSLSDDWFATASVQHREFPGSAAEWDFTEFELDIAHRSGFGAKVDYSPDYYERDSAAVAAEVRFVDQLHRRAYWYVEAGLVEIDAPEFLDHQYARVGLGGSLARAQLDVSYRWNSRRRSEFFGSEPFSRSKIVVELAYRLR